MLFEDPRMPEPPQSCWTVKKKSESPHFLCLFVVLPSIKKPWKKAKVDSQQPAQTKLISLVLCYIGSAESEGIQLLFSAGSHATTHPASLIGSIRFLQEKKKQTRQRTNDVLEGVLSERKEVR